MEVSRTLRHGIYYGKQSREVTLDIVTSEDWIIEVKTGKGRMRFRQIERYTRARVEGRYKGIFAVYVENPLNRALGPSHDDMRLMKKFVWPHGLITVSA